MKRELEGYKVGDIAKVTTNPDRPLNGNGKINGVNGTNGTHAPEQMITLVDSSEAYRDLLLRNGVPLDDVEIAVARRFTQPETGIKGHAAEPITIVDFTTNSTNGYPPEVLGVPQEKLETLVKKYNHHNNGTVGNEQRGILSGKKHKKRKRGKRFPRSHDTEADKIKRQNRSSNESIFTGWRGKTSYRDGIPVNVKSPFMQENRPKKTKEPRIPKVLIKGKEMKVKQ